MVAAIRAAAPGLEISCSTQEDIDLGGAPNRIAAINAWTSPPDLVSVNLAEAGAIELGSALLRRGVGLEDSLVGRDGGPAPANPVQVAATVAGAG